MSPEELQAIAYGVAQIAMLFGALGAVLVQLALVVIRGFSDWFLEREEKHKRIACARMRGQCGPLLRPGEVLSRSLLARVLRDLHAASAAASEEAPDGWAGACDRHADRRALSAAPPIA